MSRGASWSEEEIKVLITTDIQEQLDGAKRNRPIFVKIAKALEEEGFDRTWLQCRTKMKSLKAEYRTVKDSNNCTGRDRKTCRYFDELDEILGHRPASAPSHLLDVLRRNEADTDESIQEGKQSQHVHNNNLKKDETQSSASFLDSASESQHTERAAEGDAVEGKSVVEKGLLVKHIKI